MSSQRKRYINSCEVLDIKTYNLNGYEQKVLFEGKSKTSPIIIFLHGGPGSPIPFCAGSRGLFPEITDYFIMVYWDQLGCGINDYTIDNTFTINDFCKMTIDLIRSVHNDFPDNPITLFGISWGSILAAMSAEQVPDLISRVLVYGQVTKDLFFNQEVFNTLEKIEMNKKNKEKVAYLKSRFTKDQKDIMVMAKLIRKYTQGYNAKNGGKTPMGKIIWGLFSSPDYTLKNFKAIMVNGTLKNQSLYKELISIDLSETLEKISIPYLIMQGSTDIVTSTSYMQSLIKKSNNKNLHLDIIPDSGHMPSAKGMKYVIEKGLEFLSHIK